MLRHDSEYYRSRKPKPELGRWESFKVFIWDREQRAFLDRTGREWANVGLFYLCFYGVLFAAFFVQLWATLKYVQSHDGPVYSYNKPTPRLWLGSGYEIDYLSSGISVKPDDIMARSNPPLILVSESTQRKSKAKSYIIAVRDMLGEYRNAPPDKYEHECDERVLRDPSKKAAGGGGQEEPTKPCYFDLAKLGACAKSPYGYAPPIVDPCVYIKFNKVLKGVPIFYTQASQLPSDMPDWLKRVVRKSDKPHVWLSCNGTSFEDTLHMGEIEYLPGPGFPVQYFPYDGHPDYLSPMVALKFSRPAVNELINIDCTTWAHNIDRSYKFRFRMLIKV
uniref:Sodium/potassium-transporting ATPase subunit beta n=1 Tax=Trichogramma kaykai TaxID=54128 RepID=A0ABD2XPD0_9HYME